MSRSLICGKRGVSAIHIGKIRMSTGFAMACRMLGHPKIACRVMPAGLRVRLFPALRRVDKGFLSIRVNAEPVAIWHFSCIHSNNGALQ
jgi:hypothetical protein